MFNGKQYATIGVKAEIPFNLQMFMWKCIAMMPEPKDYLQVFILEAADRVQSIIHTSEQPEYRKEYRIGYKKPITQKVYVIDDEDHSTMLLAEEY